MPPKASKRKAANGYKLPDPIPEGTVVTGTNKKQFRLGKSIGLGGFGEIYLASEDISRPVGDDATLALKIEPHENGPLFVEMNFYIRSAQPQMVEEFKKARNLKSFGMPCLRGSGSHVHKGEKYRFLVMDRYGKDLQKVFQTGKKLFSDRVTYNLALKIIDVLEYIHYKGYVHNDIKAQNLLLGYGRTKENDVFLVDFGLVSKYQKEGVHYEYKPDARKAHDGTIEYTSRDAHIGAHSRRSDLEILAYNLVHWMSGDLPWMDNLTNPQYVHAQKKGYMNDTKAFLQRCFKSDDYPPVLEEFLNYAVKLEFDTEPDYDKCRKMFKSALTKSKFPLDGKIDFTTPKNAPKKARKRKRSDFEDIDFSEENLCRKSSRITKNNSENGRVVSAPHPTPAASPTPDDMAINEWSWEKILCSDPELLIRQASRQSETEDESPLALQHKALDERRQKESLRNPTEAMREIMARIEEREREREQMTWQQQLQHFNQNKKPSSSNRAEIELALENPNPLTPAMEEVIKMRQKRISVDIDIPITPEPSDSENDQEEFDDCSSHEEYMPKYVPVKKSPSPKGKRLLKRGFDSPLKSNVPSPIVSKEDDPFEFRDDEDETDLGHYKSCLNVVNTAASTASNSTDSTPTTAKSVNSENSNAADGVKRRRISIQNEVTPIRNKESPQAASSEDTQPPSNPSRTTTTTTKKKGRRAKKKTTSSTAPKAKRLSSIPEEVFIESIQRPEAAASTPPAPPRRGRGRPPRRNTTTKQTKAPLEPSPPALRRVKGRRKVSTSASNTEAAAATAAAAVVVEKKSSRMNMRSSDASMRTTRAQDWKWENVLLSNPERILRRANKQ